MVAATVPDGRIGCAGARARRAPSEIRIDRLLPRANNTTRPPILRGRGVNHDSSQSVSPKARWLGMIVFARMWRGGIELRSWAGANMVYCLSARVPGGG